MAASGAPPPPVDAGPGRGRLLAPLLAVALLPGCGALTPSGKGSSAKGPLQVWIMEPGAPFHIHFSDVQFANRNETKHLPYGQGTLRAEPFGEALARFERPATVISESPDEESHQAIRAALASAAVSSSRRSKASASSSRPRARSS